MLGFLFLSFLSTSFAVPTLHPGWPVQIGNPEWGAWHFDYLSTWTNADGSTLIAVASSNGMTVLDLDANHLPGWPREWASSQDIGHIRNGPQIGDLDGDSIPEFVVQTVKADSGYFYRIFGLNGMERTELTRFHPFVEGYQNPISAPVLVDIDEDGTDELFYIADSMVYGVEGTGNNIQGFPWPKGEADGSFHGTVVVGIGSSWGGEAILVWGTKNLLHARFLWSDTEIAGWPVPYTELQPDDYYSPLTLFGNSDEWYVGLIDERHAYLFDQTGTLLEGFPASNPIWDGHSGSSYDLIAADIQGNNEPELLFKNFSFHLYARDHTGAIIPDFPLTAGDNGGAEPAVIAIAGNLPLIFGSSVSNDMFRATIYGFYNGSPLAGFPFSQLFDNHVLAYSVSAIFNSSPSMLHLVVATPRGEIVLYDVSLDTPIDRFEWPMPGNTPGGNRYYQPTLPVGVEEQDNSSLPVHSELGPLYPNPTNGLIRMTVPLTRDRPTEVIVYDLLGRVVNRSEFPERSAGSTTVVWAWEGTDQHGTPVASGLYLVRVEGSTTQIRRALLIR
ncbi:T9SS type A sorting domain-containing protein [bacterium]|nr:T9SS type A sorting domain-containing protein [bacterium]